MRQGFYRVFVALLLLGVGWTAGKAQLAQPDFELIVNAPVGETTVTCKRGCNLFWIERGIPSTATPSADFTFKCGGQGTERCSSATVGGWLVR
jgi:hypothetical protein